MEFILVLLWLKFIGAAGGVDHQPPARQRAMDGEAGRGDSLAADGNERVSLSTLLASLSRDTRQQMAQAALAGKRDANEAIAHVLEKLA